MHFFSGTYIFIRKSDRTMSVFSLGKDIIYNNMDYNLNILYSKDVINGYYYFSDLWLEIDSNDTIYGVINNKRGKLININIKDQIIEEETILKYDYENYFIKFPFVKNNLKENHLIYYSISEHTPNCATLVHIYRNNDSYKKNFIDYIDYNILTNFVITWDNNIPTIFYFKLVNKHEELFVSSFNLNSLNWSSPIQITDSRKTKIYLSVLKSDDNLYHIGFSENNNEKYNFKYLTLYIKNNNFKIYNASYISSNIMCLFPCLIKHGSTLYAQWIEYYNLYTCKSNDFGQTWSKPVSYSYLYSSPALIYQFKSNFDSDSKYTLSSLFTFKNYFDIDKLLPKY